MAWAQGERVVINPNSTEYAFAWAVLVDGAVDEDRIFQTHNAAKIAAEDDAQIAPVAIFGRRVERIDQNNPFVLKALSHH